jgi:prophage antirepressor-like protein
MNRDIRRIFGSQKVRAVMIDKELWYVALDVCRILEIDDTSAAVRPLDADEKQLYTLYTSGQDREIWLVSEAGLYSLIMTSRKPKARSLKRLITHDILPNHAAA